MNTLIDVIKNNTYNSKILKINII